MSHTDNEVKRFVAASMSRALELVRDELGPEAIILSSRRIAEGVEIITSVERDLPTRGISERRAFGQNFDVDVDRALDSDSSWQSQAGIARAASEFRTRLEGNAEAFGDEAERKAGSGADLAQQIERARERMFAAKRHAEARAHREDSGQSASRRAQVAKKAPPPASKANEAQSEQRLEDLRSELADLRMLLEQQLWRGDEPVSIQSRRESVASNTVELHLRKLGLHDSVVEELVKQNRGLRPNEAWKRSLALLARCIPTTQHAAVARGGRFAFVGPTGVGKTTTLTKLAAQFTIDNGPGKLALISMDTSRVGAMEQLQSLGRMLDAPVRKVDSSNSLLTTLSSLRDFPLVLIDTAGYRHGDPKLRQQLAQLDECPQVQRLLVLSVLSQYQNIKASIHAYRPRPAQDATVLSKLDEASALGEALSALIQHKLAVAYITDGQQIPGDIREASGHTLVAAAVALAKTGTVSESVPV